MSNTRIRLWSLCAPVLALLAGCSDGSAPSSAGTSLEAETTVFHRSGAAGESLRFQIPLEARVTTDDVLRLRDKLGLAADDELRLFRASKETNGYATRNYRLYRSGALVEGAALVLSVRDGFVVGGFGTLTADHESPAFALSDTAAWEGFVAGDPSQAKRTIASTERALLPRSSTNALAGFTPAYRFTYTTDGALGSRTVVVDATSGHAIPAAHTPSAVSVREPSIASMRRELDALRAREATLAPRPTAVEPSAMVPRVADDHELGHTLILAAADSIFGARTGRTSVSKPIDDALREIFALSHAYYRASDGFAGAPSFDWGTGAAPVARGRRDATALTRWYYLLAHGAPAGDGAPEVRGIGVADATLVLYHAITTGVLGAGSDFDSFASAVGTSARDLFGAGSPEVAAVGGALEGAGITTDGLVVGVGGGVGRCIAINCTPQYVVYPSDGTTDVDPWVTYFAISPMPSTAVLTEFQVSTDPQFANDADMAYTYKTVACGQYNSITQKTFVSTACSATQGRNIVLRPGTHYYWRWRINPAIGTTWGSWSAPIGFTTAVKQVTISGPGSDATVVNAEYPWGVPFAWSNTPEGTTGYELKVSEDCTFSGAKVASGAATHPSDVMSVAIADPATLSAKMDLDNYKSYCWTVVPKGPAIGPSPNPGNAATSTAHTPPTYATFRTSGAKSKPTAPTNAATSIAPWNEQFKWTSLPLATGYQVDIASTDTFASVLKCNIKVAGQTTCAGSKMKPSTQYFWRVQAQGPIDPRTNKPRLGDYNDTTVTGAPNPGVIDPPWSPVTALSFTTSDGVVVLQSPVDGGTADVGDVKLAFADNGADSYTIELTTVAGQYEQQSGPQAGDAIPGVSYQYLVDAASTCNNGVCTYTVPDALTLHKKYYWRVQGYAVGTPGAWSNYGADWSFTVEHPTTACVSPCSGQVVDPWPVPLKFKRVAGAKKYHITMTNFVPEQNADDGATYPAWTNGMSIDTFPGLGAMYTFTEVVDANGGGADPNTFVFNQWVRPHPQLNDEGPSKPGSHHWNVVVEYDDASMSTGFSGWPYFLVHDDKRESWTAGPCPDAALAVIPGANSYKIYACNLHQNDPPDQGEAAFDNAWELDCKHYGVPVQSVTAPGNVTTVNITWPPNSYILLAAAASPDDVNGQGGHNAGDPQGNNDGAQHDPATPHGPAQVACYTN